MDPIILALCSILASILIYSIYQAWKINQFWKERGVPHIKPWLFLGSTTPWQLLKHSQPELLQIICKHYPNEPMFGIHSFMAPVLLIRDLDYIEKILIKDFAHFVDHGIPIDDTRNPLDSNLFGVNGKRWKAIRNKLSPIFTSGKLKMMYDTMAECGNELMTQMDKMEGKDVEIKEILACFAMDSIGSCVFGIDAGNLAKPENKFRQMGKKVLEVNFFTFVKLVLIFQLPLVAKLLNLTFSKKDVVQYFAGIVKETLQYRRESGFQRNDFVQMILQLQEKGYVEMQTKDASDDYLITETSTEKFELSEDQLTGHAISFLSGGHDNITAVMLFCIYELSKHLEIQGKVREEILSEVKKTGKLNYDAVRDMNYLEQCVKETLRKYPPGQALIRKCVKEYTFPTGLTIHPGQILQIPLMVIQNDPRHFSEPERFLPERFDSDHDIPTCAYMPFGNGPRICIAMRFAMLQIKFCIAKLIMNYEFKLSSKTEEPLKYAGSFITTPKNAIYFNIKRNQSNNN